MFRFRNFIITLRLYCLFWAGTPAFINWDSRWSNSVPGSATSSSDLLNLLVHIYTYRTNDTPLGNTGGLTWRFTQLNDDDHHHHVVPLARISLILSCHFSLSFIASGRSSGLHLVSSHSCWMYVRAGRPAFARHMWGSIGVHHLWARPCFSSSVLHFWFV